MIAEDLEGLAALCSQHAPSPFGLQLEKFRFLSFCGVKPSNGRDAHGCTWILGLADQIGSGGLGKTGQRALAVRVTIGRLPLEVGCSDTSIVLISELEQGLGPVAGEA